MEASRNTILNNNRLRSFVVGSLAALAIAGSVEEASANYNPSNGPNHTDRVILTYDDCPRDLSNYRRTLDYASSKEIGLGIFLTGACVSDYKKKHHVNLVDIARQDGHYVGNHTKNHKDLKKLLRSDVRKEIEGGVESNYVRPPYGKYNSTVSSVIRELGLRNWMWGLDTRDWEGKSRKQVVHSVVDGAKRGETVLMHMQWHGFNIKAIKQIKNGLDKRNLQLCRPWRDETTGEITESPVMLPRKLAC